MKPTKLFFFLFLFSFIILSCKKKEEPIPDPGSNQPDFFIKFKLNGAQYNFEAEEGSAFYYGSLNNNLIFQLPEVTTDTGIRINFLSENDFEASSFLALEGDTVEYCTYDPVTGIQVDIGSFISSEKYSKNSDNTDPTQSYFIIDDIVQNPPTSLGQDNFTVSGRFACKVSAAPPEETITEGSFRILMVFMP